MAKKALIGIMLVGGLISFGATTVSALSVGDIQAQAQALLAQISALTAQLNSLQGQGNQNSQNPILQVSPNIRPMWRICNLLPSRPLTVGLRGDDVLSLQEFLQAQGYFSANASGYFGPITAAAVAKWQASQGVSAVGAFGPMSRERIRIWCGNPNPNPNPTPTCKPINYMPPLCSDGSTPQAQHNKEGCIIGYECPVANFIPPANCKAWNDGCNICSRQTPDSPAMCTMRACLTGQGFAAGKGYCTTYFDSGAGGGYNKPPVISGFSGPTTLSVNQIGMWAVQASDPENGSLSYHITWGDESTVTPMMGAAMTTDAFVQATTFTHSYSNVGTYTVTATVRDSAGQSAQTSTTVQVGNGGVVCTMEYAPVCGQPPEPACRHSVPACMIATPGPQTYGNRCAMNTAGATFLYEGQCHY